MCTGAISVRHNTQMGTFFTQSWGKNYWSLAVIDFEASEQAVFVAYS